MPLGRIGLFFGVFVLAVFSPRAHGQTQVSARIDAWPIYSVKPERFLIPLPLEPARKITMVATADGLLRSVGVSLGANVRENAEVLQVDRTEAQAKLKIAEAIVKERSAELEEAKKNNGNVAIQEAKLEAARGEVDLARLVLDHCTYRAPFAGKITSAPWSPGQMFLKGAVLAELADVSNLRVLVPVERNAVQLSSQIKLMVEGRQATGKVDALLPIPESFSILRELAGSYVAAWVSIPNSRGEFEPGMRASSPYLPDQPITNVPSKSVHDTEEDAVKAVQVLRNEIVMNLPVKVLGPVGTDSMQVSGAFRVNDLLIAETSTPLAAGTFVQFGGAGVEGVAPDPNQPGAMAVVTAPAGSLGVAPIGSGGGSGSTKARRSTTGSASRKPAASSKPAGSPNRPSGDAAPF